METKLIDTAPAFVDGDAEKSGSNVPTPDQELKKENKGMETGPFPAALICALVAE